MALIGYPGKFSTLVILSQTMSYLRLTTLARCTRKPRCTIRAHNRSVMIVEPVVQDSSTEKFTKHTKRIQCLRVHNLYLTVHDERTL